MNYQKGGAKFIIIILLLIVLVLLLVWGRGGEQAMVENNETQTKEELMVLADGRYCFNQVTESVEGDPYYYRVEEDVVLNVSGSEVSGTKNGFQENAELSNGYTGNLIGSIAEDGMINLTWNYTIEGSEDSVEEVYRYVGGNLIQSKWPMFEKDGVLTADKNFEPSDSVFTPVECL